MGLGLIDGWLEWMPCYHPIFWSPYSAKCWDVCTVLVKTKSKPSSKESRKICLTVNRHYSLLLKRGKVNSQLELPEVSQVWWPKGVLQISGDIPWHLLLEIGKRVLKASLLELSIYQRWSKQKLSNEKGFETHHQIGCMSKRYNSFLLMISDSTHASNGMLIKIGKSQWSVDHFTKSFPKKNVATKEVDSNGRLFEYKGSNEKLWCPYKHNNGGLWYFGKTSFKNQVAELSSVRTHWLFEQKH